MRGYRRCYTQANMNNVFRVSTRLKEASMAVIAFIASVACAGALASTIKVETGTSNQNTPDYRMVPFAGDCLGHRG